MHHDIEFLGSFPSVNKVPKDTRPHFAFVGRSNVGKSSLINMLTGRKQLARVSKQPGKTQMINLFAVDASWILVDLPGYGYARESKKKRKSWDIMVKKYLQDYAHLKVVFLLLDSNISLQQNDREFLQWIGTNQIPFALIYTKIDRLKSSKRMASIKKIRSALLEDWEFLPAEFAVSSITNEYE